MADWNVPLGRQFDPGELERIEKLYPHCPTCGEPAEKMYFYVVEVRKMWLEIDGSFGASMTDIDRCLINVDDDPADRWVSQPYTSQDYPKVECENGHEWTETTISLRSNHWRVREP
jgi:hypothetical protein